MRYLFAPPYFKKDFMENYIIIIIIAVFTIIGIGSTVKHFKGKGGCCGNGGYKLKRKKLPNVLYEKSFRIEGMQCKNCKNRVEEIINDIKGIAGRVNLKKGELTIYYAENVDNEVIFHRIRKAGYNISKKI